LEPFLQKLEISSDDQQQVVKIVGDATGELSDRLHLLGLRQTFLALSQSLFHMLPIAQIMDHSGEKALPIGREFANR
jgi:hypothetical protein